MKTTPADTFADAGRRARYRWFNAGVGSWYLAWGMQGVLFSWLVVNELGLGAEHLGIAQTLNMLPSLLLVLVGGATADRVDRRRLIMTTQLLGAALVATLAATVGAGMLTYPLIIVFALCMGTVVAFSVPTRDSLLSEVAGADMMKAVAGMTLVQWSAMALGNLAAAASRWLGTARALGIEAMVIAVGAAAFSFLEADRHRSRAAFGDGALGEIREGIAEVLDSPKLRPVFVLEVSAGLLFMGPFLVVIPLLVRDVYGGDVGQLGVLMMAFPCGVIVGSSILLWRGGIRRKGRALPLAVGAEALSLWAVGSGMRFEGLWFAVFCWGLAAAVSINVSRTVFQENAPESHRARVLSIYTLGLLGTAPLGSLLAGYLSEAFGPQNACLFSAVGVFAVLVAALLLTPLARLE